MCLTCYITNDVLYGKGFPIQLIELNFEMPYFTLETIPKAHLVGVIYLHSRVGLIFAIWKSLKL